MTRRLRGQLGRWPPLARLVHAGLFTHVCHPQRVYELLSTRNHLGERSHYINLGYWASATRFDDACEALAMLLAHAASLSSAQHVLDVGFGFGDQDLLWARHFPQLAIHGVNITPLQVRVARERVAAAGLEAQIDLQQGSATALPGGASCFDRVVGLETAFHFDTREAFFREAHRVLRPGGRLAVTDLIPTAASGRWGWGLEWELVRRSWQIPPANLYPAQEYADRLRCSGFTDVQVESIGDRVFEPMARFLRAHLESPEIVARLDPIVRRVWKATMTRSGSFDRFDYVLVSATKAAPENGA